MRRRVIAPNGRSNPLENIVTGGRGINLDLDKWWEQDGGNISVSLSCGHKWDYPVQTWSDDGLDYYDISLGPELGEQHMWSVFSDEDISKIESELAELIPSLAIPWFERVSTKKGFVDWFRGVYSRDACFRYTLDAEGPAALMRDVLAWLSTLPRRIDDDLTWLATVDIISQDLAADIRMASMQTEDTYRERLELIKKDIEQDAAPQIRPRW